MVVNGVDIEVERKPIKNLHLAVYPPDGRVHVSAPQSYTDEQIKLFVLKKWMWLVQKRIELTSAVVKKYAALTEDEIKMLVVERKWLASIISGCEALMQNVTHQIASDVTALAERYEVTLGATESHVKDLEQEVLQSLKEMGFTI